MTQALPDTKDSRTHSPAGTTAASPKELPLPEDRFWIRYSPHHEMPLSSVSSFAIHVVVIGLIILVGWLMVSLNLTDGKRPLETAPIMKSDSGASQSNIDEGPVKPNPRTQQEAVGPQEPKKERTPLDEPSVKLPKLELARPNRDDLKGPDVKDIGAISDREVARTKDAFDQLKTAISKTQQPSGKDKAGSGRDGVKDSGIDKGGNYQPDVKVPPTIERAMRWILVFNTQNGGEDYARQLQALGAILAIPDQMNQGQYLVVRDLSRRPVVARSENIADIKRIFWIDTTPDSVRSLAQALKLPSVPAHIAAFFPEELEMKLLRLELARAGGRTEDDIHETRFELLRKGNSYEPRVTHQDYKR